MDWILAFDAGGTYSRAGLYDAAGRRMTERPGGPGNPVSNGERQTINELARLGKIVLDGRTGSVTVVAAVAGAAQRDVQQRLAVGLGQALGAQRTLVTTDLHPLLFANAGDGTGVLVVAGTGSCVLGQDAQGRILRRGGRGMLLGDTGGACQVAIAALRAAARSFDGLEAPSELPEALAKASGFAAFEDLVPWSSQASKAALASLAPAVTALAEAGDALALACVRRQAEGLAAQVRAAFEALDLTQTAPVWWTGGLLTCCAFYRNLFTEALAGYALREPEYTGHAAAVRLALAPDFPAWVTEVGPQSATGLPATETMPTADVVTLDMQSPLDLTLAMALDHDETGIAVRAQASVIAAAVEQAAATLRNGRNLYYIGAGTSGRLGVLDASECPPTFGVEPGRVVGIMAGGDTALRASSESAEDRREQGADDVLAAGIQAGDLLVGIAASGRTPYVHGALEAARARGAFTVLLCCNPDATAESDLVIALDTGPEILAGSTRLKAGTATKLVLNILSTGAMALSGHVYKGLMVGMRPANEKLRLRAARIIAAIAQVSETEAATLLEAGGNHIATAIVMARHAIDAEQARQQLAQHGGDLRATLERGGATR